MYLFIVKILLTGTTIYLRVNNVILHAVLMQANDISKY